MGSHRLRLKGQNYKGKKSGDFNLTPQEECVKILQLSPGPELQKVGIFASSTEPQSQCVETMPLYHGPQLENTKSVFRDKCTQNLGIRPQGITSKELKPSVQERDVPGRGRQISEFEARLVYKVSSRTARAIKRSPVSKNQKEKKKSKCYRIFEPVSSCGVAQPLAYTFHPSGWNTDTLLVLTFSLK